MRFSLRLTLTFIFFLSCLSNSFGLAGEYPKAPLTDRIVAALVVGGALPESVAADIHDHALDFHPEEQYLIRLQKSGASPVIIQALRQAKLAKAGTNGQRPEDAGVLDHILAAGEKLQAKKVFEAAKDIASSGGNLEGNPELAFVMAELVRLQSRPAQSASIYAKLADVAPEFPEVHTKFSFALYKVGDYERGLQEAIAALARTPSNPEAHKNKGLNLEAMGNFDAAIAEYQQALALKPNYEKIHYDLGLLYHHRKDYRNSITEYRKAVLLDPSDVDAHYNLALVLRMVHEDGSAIAECREVIRLNPQRIDARMELAGLLVETGATQEGIGEFRQLITLSPDSSYCHHCFGWLLYKAHELDEAAKEFRTAIQLDPVDPDPHSGLGVVLREQKHNEDALKEFLEALRLGLDTGAIHREIGSVYLAQKRNGDAILELKQSVSRSPADARAHLFLAQAFEADGNMNDAIAEYRQAAMLAGSNNVGGEQIAKSLAAALEKNGRSREALETYKGRYEALPNEETKADYDAARKRLGASSDGANQHEAKLTGARGTQKPIVSASAAKADAEAAQLPVLFQQKFDGMQKAMMEQHWNQAEELGNGAVAVAEKMVPQDERLISALRGLAQIYSMEHKFSEAEKQDFRALRASEDLFGPKSMTSQSVLNDLGGLYVRSQNLPQAIEYLNRALAIADGPTNAVPALERLGDVYLQQGDFKNAEQAYKKMLAGEEAHYGPGTFGTIAGLERMGQLYCNTHDYAQAQNFFERMLAIEEKQFGPNSTMLQGPLDHLATALHGLGKDEEARALEHRRQVIAQNQVH